MSLRPYQTAAIANLRAAYAAGARAVVLVLPTGGGKTRIAAEVISSVVSKGRRALMLAHRQELITQSADHLRREGLHDLRVIQAGGAVGSPDAPVTVASIQTLATKRWADRMPAADVVIFDECHHTRASSWERIARHYHAAHLLGLTATPERSDGAPLGDIFQALVVASTVAELTAAGFLVPCEVYGPIEQSSALADDPVEVYLACGEGEPAVVFCANVVHAEEIAARLQSAGVPAACVDGTMSKRDRADRLARFGAGELRVVTNCAVLTEGWDAPATSVCILARGAEHAGLYQQMVGRVLRPASGKTKARVYDLKGISHTHGLPDQERIYSLTGKAISTLEKLPALMQCKGCGAVYRPALSCPVCGTVRKPPDSPEVVKQRLERIFASHGPEKRAEYREKLTATARERNYHPRWVDHRFAARYGRG